MGAGGSILTTVAQLSKLPADGSDIESRPAALAEVARMRLLLRTHAMARAPLPDGVSVSLEVGACPCSLADQWAAQSLRGGKSARRVRRVVVDAAGVSERAADAAGEAAFDAYEAAAEAIDAVPAFARRVAAGAAAASEAAAVAALHSAETIAPERADLMNGFALCAARCAVAAADVYALAAEGAVAWLRTLAAREIEATAAAAAAALKAASARGEASDEASDRALAVDAELVAVAATAPNEPATSAASVSATAPVADFIRACALGDALSVATLLAAPRRGDTPRAKIAQDPPRSLSPHRYNGHLSPTIGQEQWRAPGAIAAGKTIAPLCAAARCCRFSSAIRASNFWFSSSNSLVWKIDFFWFILV